MSAIAMIKRNLKKVSFRKKKPVFEKDEKPTYRMPTIPEDRSSFGSSSDGTELPDEEWVERGPSLVVYKNQVKRPFCTGVFKAEALTLQWGKNEDRTFAFMALGEAQGMPSCALLALRRLPELLMEGMMARAARGLNAPGPHELEAVVVEAYDRIQEEWSALEVERGSAGLSFVLFRKTRNRDDRGELYAFVLGGNTPILVSRKPVGAGPGITAKVLGSPTRDFHDAFGNIARQRSSLHPERYVVRPRMGFSPVDMQKDICILLLSPAILSIGGPSKLEYALNREFVKGPDRWMNREVCAIGMERINLALNDATDALREDSFFSIFYLFDWSRPLSIEGSMNHTKDKYVLVTRYALTGLD